MHAKQERVDRLNCFNDKVFLIPVYLSFLQPNKLFYFWKWRLFRCHVVCDLY